MEMKHVQNIVERTDADALVIPFWKEGNQKQAAFDMDKALDKTWHKQIASVLASGDFKGNEGEFVYLYVTNGLEKRLILLGLGEKDLITAETLRRSFGALIQSCIAKQLNSLNIAIPQLEFIHQDILLNGIADGVLLANYVFNVWKHNDTNEQSEIQTLKKPLERVTWVGIDDKMLEVIQQAGIVAKGVYYARDLVNGNADEVTPQYLTQCAKEIAKKIPAIKTTVFDKNRIVKEKMGLLLAVSRGAAVDPAFIMMEYRGDPKSSHHTVIVGKGVTYDTGGLNLKPTGGIETMKCDMAGAAACYGIIMAVCQLGLKLNVTVVIPTTENSIDANSFKPGDVYESYSGKSVEMTNSDAEGRLILADALAYAIAKLKPTRLIDIATLTGAIEIALGSEASGLMSTDDALAGQLVEAGEKTYERLWRMPLYEEYKERLKSDIADIKSWNGRSGSSNVAATFLRYFVKPSIPWAHIDIAGTAYVSEAKKYVPKYATGMGVRLIVEFLKNDKNES